LRSPARLRPFGFPPRNIHQTQPLLLALGAINRSNHCDRRNRKYQTNATTRFVCRYEQTADSIRQNQQSRRPGNRQLAWLPRNCGKHPPPVAVKPRNSPKGSSRPPGAPDQSRNRGSGVLACQSADLNAIARRRIMFTAGNLSFSRYCESCE
jgi:hypothetical protein